MSDQASVPRILSNKYGLSDHLIEFNVVGRIDSVVKPGDLYGCTDYLSSLKGIFLPLPTQYLEYG